MREFLKWFYQHRHEFNKITPAHNGEIRTKRHNQCPLQAWTGKMTGYTIEATKLIGDYDTVLAIINAADNCTWDRLAVPVRTKMDRILAMK